MSTWKIKTRLQETGTQTDYNWRASIVTETQWVWRAWKTNSNEAQDNGRGVKVLWSLVNLVVNGWTLMGVRHWRPVVQLKSFRLLNQFQLSASRSSLVDLWAGRQLGQQILALHVVMFLFHGQPRLRQSTTQHSVEHGHAFLVCAVHPSRQLNQYIVSDISDGNLFLYCRLDYLKQALQYETLPCFVCRYDNVSSISASRDGTGCGRLWPEHIILSFGARGRCYRYLPSSVNYLEF